MSHSKLGMAAVNTRRLCKQVCKQVWKDTSVFVYVEILCMLADMINTMDHSW